MARRLITFGRFTLAVCILSVGAVGGAIYWAADFYRREIPSVDLLHNQYPVVRYRGPHQSPLIELQKRRPSHWVGIEMISKSVLGAVVVSEDWAFFQHKGYDPNQIVESIKKDWKDGKFSRGASTITQQVVKNVFLEQDKNLWRKFKELYLAAELEESLQSRKKSTYGKKQKILEIYLNIAEWGEGIFGIKAASQHYFGKSPQELNAKEGAFLAMLLPSPKRYGQSFRSKRLTHYARQTIESILGKMVQAHYLTEEEMNSQVLIPYSFEQS